MLTKRIIPCLDVKDGRVVKGIKFQGLRDAGNPVELAHAYEEHGADELVILDVSATPEGRGTALKTVAEVRNVLSIPLCVGGGVREVAHARALLEAGADKVGINTAAVSQPQLITAISEQFGKQCTVLAVDAAATEDSWEVVTHSGKTRPGIDAIEWCREGERRGAGEILLTSWDRDGTRSGYDLKLLKASSNAIELPIIASGGANGPEHLLEAFQVGAHAVLAASIFHDGEYTVNDIKTTLREQGIEVRL